MEYRRRRDARPRRCSERGPLELQEAPEIASQFLAGLEAIHQAGLVHRDVKPENVMLTRAGPRGGDGLRPGAGGVPRSGTGTIAGTPAYMAPEQARGDGGRRAGGRVRGGRRAGRDGESWAGSGVHEAAQALWRALRETRRELPDSPWAPVLRTALSPEPRERARLGARACSRARGGRRCGFRGRGAAAVPGPRLASPRPTPSTSSAASSRSRRSGRSWSGRACSALIGPSGAGKSSFLRAGLLPALPRGWRGRDRDARHAPLRGAGPGAGHELRPATPRRCSDLLRFEEPDVALALVPRWRQAPRARAADRRPVRGAVHAERRRRCRRASRELLGAAGARGRRPRRCSRCATTS